MTHLTPLIRSQEISIWHDGQIQPGAEWRREIENALKRSAVAVLLVSPAFLASQFIAENEFAPILANAKEAGVKVLWVAVSASLYDMTALRDYQAVNNPSRPLDSYIRSPYKLASELVQIAKEIHRAYALVETSIPNLSGIWQDINLGQPYDREAELTITQEGETLSGKGDTSAEQGIPDSPYAFKARLSPDGILRGDWWTTGQRQREGAAGGPFEGKITENGGEVRLRRTTRTKYGTGLSDWVWRKKPPVAD